MTSARQWKSINELAAAVQSAQQTASQQVEKALNCIEENKSYAAIISTTAESARQRAKMIDDKVKNGEAAGRLAGVPFIAKDNFLTFGGETTAASNMLKGFNAPYQSTAINRLEAEGAICVAKANLDAFAHGSSTENSDYMITKNPHDSLRVPGGSSGGSAAAVVLDMVPFALGTDTGGSIRLPASFCGAIGYKPTYGLVSRSGVVAMASSADVIGPITRSVADAGLILDVIAGRDELDSTTIERDPKSYVNLTGDWKGKKVGLIQECMQEGLHPQVRPVIDEAIKKISSWGAIVSEVSVPTLPLALAVYYILVPAEISSNLSRYDGQRYGYSYDEALNLDESFTATRSRGFGKEAKRRIMLGTFVLSSGFYDAYYKRAQTVRTKLINEFRNLFTEYDVLINPTAGITAFPIGELVNEPLKMYFTDSMTVSANLVDIPAISIPIGWSEKMPVGLQIAAPQGADRFLLGLAHQAEKFLS